MIKKITAYCLLLTVFLVLVVPLWPVSVYATGATLSLSPTSGTFNKGCNFTLTINLDTGGAQTDGTDAILFYDPTRFTAQTIHSGTIYSDYPGNNIDVTNGKITVSGLSSVSSAFNGAGALATVDFTVVSSAPTGTSQVKFDFDPADKTKTTDSNVVERGTIADILNQVVDGNFTIGTGTSCSLNVTPSKKPVGGPEEATPIPTKAPLPTAGVAENTLILAFVGGALTVLGVLGLALL